MEIDNLKKLLEQRKEVISKMDKLSSERYTLSMLLNDIDKQISEL